MKHHKSTRKFGREKDVRNALIKGLALSLIIHGGIKTTEAKAKELRPFIEKLITRAKKDSVANRRIVAAHLGNRSEEIKKLFEEIAPSFKERAGGYTRILKFPARKSDGASLAAIEFVQ